MRKFLALLSAAIVMVSCGTTEKVRVYGWEGANPNDTEETLVARFTEYKNNGIDGIVCQAGNKPEGVAKVAKAAKLAGLEFHAWIPTMLQGKTEAIDSSWYAINRKGESSLVKPAYVGYYTFLCPNKEEVFTYLSNMYGQVASVAEVDGIHLDYVRYPDVILARALWDKYGLTMDKEYADFDYCYCPKCVADFKSATGIDILTVEDPTTGDIGEMWKQFRYDVLTRFVNRLGDTIHANGKKYSAAVFPGPTISKQLVRQDFGRWDNMDIFFPMNYHDFYLGDVNWIGEQVAEEVAATKGKPVYSGLFICANPDKKAEIKDPEGHGLVPSEIEEAVKQSMENGAAGICLFTPGKMTPEHWAALKTAINKKYEPKTAVVASAE